MELLVPLFVREHRGGLYSVQVLGRPDLEVYGPSVERAKEELELLLTDRIERTHPAHQSALAFVEDARLERVEVPRALPVHGADGVEERPTMVAVLVGESRAWQSLAFPWIGLRYWIPKKEAWRAAAEAFLSQHFATWPTGQRLLSRAAREERLETLRLKAAPPSLAAFAGKNRGLTVLPLPGEREEDEEEAAPAAGEPHRHKRKRPPTPMLKKIGVCLSERAKDGELERAHGRAAEVEALFALLEQPGERAIVLVGPSGVGKSTLLSGLVYRLREERTPERLRERAVWYADGSRLIATDSMQDWQRQCLEVAGEVEEAECIWALGAAAPLLDAGKHIHSDHNVALLLRPFLAARRLMVIAEATEEEWAQVELKDAAFARCFVPFRVEEPGADATALILRSVADELGRQEHLAVDDAALAAIRQLARRYAAGKSALGSSVQFLRRLIDAVEPRPAKEPPRPVGRSQVVAHFAQETGIPELLLRDELPLDAQQVEERFHARLVGQDEVVRRLVDLVLVIKTGLSDLGKPLGSFLFVGPTGVGKTEAAKALAAYLFRSDQRLVRFDMSEYVTGDAVHRFLGGRGEEGKLVQAVRARPFSVVLLDEIEKAHPAIFDVLLQVLGEARLTDEAGRLADFKNTVLIMTSNLGAESMKRGMSQEVMRGHFVREAQRFFRPELFNRIDHIVAFHPLEEEAIRAIAEREIEKLARREGLRGRNLVLELEPAARDQVAARGVDVRYGARPLKRALEREVSVPLARLLGGAAHESERIVVRPGEEDLAFELLPLAGGRTRDARGQLTRHLAELDRLRYQLDRAHACPELRDVAERLRLLDRLARSREFWLNREAAEARLAGVEGDRQLYEAFTALRTQLAALEDMAYEAYTQRELGPLELLGHEQRRITQRLGSLELELTSRRFERADAALLYLSATKGMERHQRELVRTYLELGLVRGWQCRVFHSRHVGREEVRAERERRVAEKQQADKRVRPSERARPVAEPKRRELGLVRWQLAEKLSVEEAGEDLQAAARAASQNEPGAGELVALAFEGPHAAATLMFEHGLHQLQSGQLNGFVRLVARPGQRLAPGAAGAAQLAHPADLPKELVLRRLRDENRHQVEDLVLGVSVTDEARLYRSYERLARAALLASLYGDDGLLIARVTEVR